MSPVSPVSVFDQRLEEDSSVNRLQDSLILWKSICSSKLLAKTQLILFLNKCDLLRRKLKRGVRVNQFLPSFGDRENEVITVVKCEIRFLLGWQILIILSITQISVKNSRISKSKIRQRNVLCISIQR